MIRKTIINKYTYKGDGSDKDDDSFVCSYSARIYFLGVLIWVKEINEDITRDNIAKRKVGY